MPRPLTDHGRFENKRGRVFILTGRIPNLPAREISRSSPTSASKFAVYAAQHSSLEISAAFRVTGSQLSLSTNAHKRGFDDGETEGSPRATKFSIRAPGPSPFSRSLLPSSSRPTRYTRTHFLSLVLSLLLSLLLPRREVDVGTGEGELARHEPFAASQWGGSPSLRRGGRRACENSFGTRRVNESHTVDRS